MLDALVSLSRSLLFLLPERADIVTRGIHCGAANAQSTAYWLLAVVAPTENSGRVKERDPEQESTVPFPEVRGLRHNGDRELTRASQPPPRPRTLRVNPQSIPCLPSAEGNPMAESKRKSVRTARLETGNVATGRI